MDFVRRVACTTVVLFAVLTGRHRHVVASNDPAVSVGDLRVACGARNNADAKYAVALNDLPAECSSYLFCTGDFESIDSFKYFIKTRPAKPIFLVVDYVMYAQWTDCFQQDNCDVNSFADLIVDLNLNGVIFDGMYQIDSSKPTNDVITNGLPKFFEDIKSYCNGKNVNPLLGVVLPGVVEILPSAFAYDTIGQSVDVYLVNSVVYTGYCSDKIPLSSIDHITSLAETFNTGQLNNVDRSKVIFGVQLYAQDDTQIEWSYSEVCDRPADQTTEYCLDSLEAMYLKALVVFNGKFRGIYIRLVNLDDTTGSCKCANGVRFPGFNAYLAGLNGRYLPDGYAKCSAFSANVDC